MDTNSSIVHVKTDDIYKDIAKDLKKKLTLQTMKYTDRCLQEKNKKVIGLMKD